MASKLFLKLLPYLGLEIHSMLKVARLFDTSVAFDLAVLHPAIKLLRYKKNVADKEGTSSFKAREKHYSYIEKMHPKAIKGTFRYLKKIA